MTDTKDSRMYIFFAFLKKIRNATS